MLCNAASLGWFWQTCLLKAHLHPATTGRQGLALNDYQLTFSMVSPLAVRFFFLFCIVAVAVGGVVIVVIAVAIAAVVKWVFLFLPRPLSPVDLFLIWGWCGQFGDVVCTFSSLWCVRMHTQTQTQTHTHTHTLPKESSCLMCRLSLFPLAFYLGVRVHNLLFFVSILRWKN